MVFVRLFAKHVQLRQKFFLFFLQIKIRMERLLLIAILLQVCAAGTNLDSHFKTTIEERIDFISGRISVRNGGPDGTWKKSVWCPIDSFANGYAMKVCQKQIHRVRLTFH